VTPWVRAALAREAEQDRAMILRWVADGLLESPDPESPEVSRIEKVDAPERSP